MMVKRMTDPENRDEVFSEVCAVLSKEWKERNHENLCQILASAENRGVKIFFVKGAYEFRGSLKAINDVFDFLDEQRTASIPSATTAEKDQQHTQHTEKPSSREDLPHGCQHDRLESPAPAVITEQPKVATLDSSSAVLCGKQGIPVAKDHSECKAVNQRNFENDPLEETESMSCESSVNSVAEVKHGNHQWSAENTKDETMSGLTTSPGGAVPDASAPVDALREERQAGMSSNEGAPDDSVSDYKGADQKSEGQNQLPELQNRFSHEPSPSNTAVKQEQADQCNTVADSELPLDDPSKQKDPSHDAIMPQKSLCVRVEEQQLDKGEHGQINRLVTVASNASDMQWQQTQDKTESYAEKMKVITTSDSSSNTSIPVSTDESSQSVDVLTDKVQAADEDGRNGNNGVCVAGIKEHCYNRSDGSNSSAH